MLTSVECDALLSLSAHKASALTSLSAHKAPALISLSAHKAPALISLSAHKAPASIFSYSAIQGFGFPNGNISEKVKSKTEGFTTEELADIDKRATIAFKANNQKYNSEEDAKKQIMHEIQEYKKGQNKMKRQLTLDSYTIITTDGTELISQLTSPVASPLKKLKKKDVANEDEVETVV